jgi:hypothetical protein
MSTHIVDRIEAIRFLAQVTGHYRDHYLVAELGGDSDFSHNGNFHPATLEPHTWKLLSSRLRTYLVKPPEKALSRGQYDANRKSALSI